MILPDFEIINWATIKHGLTPFKLDNVNPASVNLELADEFVDLNSGERFQSDKFVLEPGRAILATTREYVKMPIDCAGVLYLRSSAARAGLDHALAGFVDPGFEGELTLELHAHRPFEIKAGKCYIQLVLYVMWDEPEKTYQGKYQGQRGPTKARKEKEE